jgi:glycosyltransferase involved in cell wall biosynthesis
MIHALALTGGAQVPSARFRIRQFLGTLEPYGVRLEERPSGPGSYPPVARWARPAWALASLADRLPALAATHRADVTVLQRELLSTYVTLESLTRRPRVLDVDDALWALPRGRFAGLLAARCDRVIAGNDFLAEWFRVHCPDVVVLPTAVDTNRFHPAPRPIDGRVVIGWSGASGGLRYLERIADPLGRVLRRHPGAVLRILTDRKPSLPHVPTAQLDWVLWSPTTEVPTIQGFDLGLMPLEDSVWERGKCSYKMLLYLACGVPALVSPVGMNREVLAADNVGAGVADDAWEAALEDWIDDATRRAAAGAAGRSLVCRSYSTQVLAPSLAAALAGTVSR